jgi:hypothetical protein
MSTDCKIIVKNKKKNNKVELYLSHDGYPKHVGPLLRSQLQQAKEPEDFLWDLMATGEGFEPCYFPGTNYTYEVVPEESKITCQEGNNITLL